MVGGVCMPYIYFQASDLIVVAGLIALLTGIRLMVEVIRSPDPEDNRLWGLLTRQSRDIVWIYSVRTMTMPFGFHLWDMGTMHFKLIDGDEITLSLPARQLKMVSMFLNRLLPHAVFGYSEERQKQFETDPALLVKH